MGIKVFETAPDADVLLPNEENDSGADEVAAEAAAALAAVENEVEGLRIPCACICEKWVLSY